MEQLFSIALSIAARRAELQREARAGYERALAAMPLREGPAFEVEIPAGMLDAIVAASLVRPSAWPVLRAHYCSAMPAMLAAQLRKRGGPEEQLFDARLSLRRMPRLSEALERLFALVSDAGISCASALGAATPSLLVEGRTLGEVYSSCHFGRSMPMLYAYPGDLAEPASIDARYPAPLIHELSHFRTSTPPAPANVHEGLAAYIGSEAWPATFSVSADALPGGQFFAALGAWIARRIGVHEALRVQAGLVELDSVLGEACATALRVYGFLHFLETGAPHLLSDAFHPARWWKLVDLHRDPALLKEFHARFVSPALAGLAPAQALWDAWLDALPWTALPLDAPSPLDHALAGRAHAALSLRAERNGLSFRNVADPAPVVLDRARCMLVRASPPDGVGAPSEHPFPPALCRE